MYENNGSNALKQYEFEIPGRQPVKKRRTVQKRNITAQMKAAIVVSALAVFALAAIFLTFRAVLNTEYRTLSAQKAELNRVSARVEQLSSELEGGGGLVAVEEKAVELGLHRADKSQLVYISLDNTDGGEVLAEDKSNRGLRLFFNKVAAIAEYLY